MRGSVRYQRMKLLDCVAARETFEQELESVRRGYGSFVTGWEPFQQVRKPHPSRTEQRGKGGATLF